MEQKNLIIYCIILIAAVAIISSIVISSSIPEEETIITVISDSTLYNGDNITIKLTTENGEPIADKQVDVSLIDANDGKNTLNLMTNNEGIATFELDGVTTGTYTLECKFGGTLGYKQSQYSTSLEVSDKVQAEEKEEQTTGTFGVCYYCQKQVPGSWGKVICDECAANKANGFKDPIPDNGGWWSEAYICGPNPGDGSKAWMYNNYHYLS